jgi:nucleoid-associated protein YejK
MYMGSNIDKYIIKYEESEELMPFTLETITKKVELVSNAANRQLIKDFCDYMTDRDLSKNHRINNLKVVISYAEYLGLKVQFNKGNMHFANNSFSL